MIRLWSAALAGVLALAPQAAPPPPASVFNSLLDTYRSGDHDVVDRTLTTPAAVRECTEKWSDAFDTKRVAWDPTRAAFAAEVLIAASEHDTVDLLKLITPVRDYVMARPIKPGIDAKQDAFELQWHRVVVALLESVYEPDVEESYLDRVVERFWGEASGGTPADPRFVLERGIAAEQKCWATELTPHSFRLAADDKTTPKGVARCHLETLARFEAAAQLPDVQPEARIRAAVADYRLGQFSDALAALDTVTPPRGDPAATYWLMLLRARTLQALTRLDDAEGAYGAAVAFCPTAQTARAGLALVLFQQNRRDAAVAAADAARAVPADATDPWDLYFAADARFVFTWRAALREMLK